MYAKPDFPSRKALKEAVARGEKVTVHIADTDEDFNDYLMRGLDVPEYGRVLLDGPDPPPGTRRWHAAGRMENGKLVHVD